MRSATKRLGLLKFCKAFFLPPNPYPLTPFLLLFLLAGCRSKEPAQVASTAPLSANRLASAAPVSFVNPALAAFHPKPTEFLSAKDPARVALTFDAGSDDRAVAAILKELTSRHVRATFFLTGRFCEQFPGSCRAIADAGMEIGNHSYSHPHFTRLTDAQIKSQMERGEAAIIKACGRGAKPLFRFPYGDYNVHADRVLADLGYQPVYWTLDSLDAYGKRKSADFVAKRINSRVKSGYVTLMHVSSVGSAAALPQIFAHLDKIKARVVPVSELLTE